MKSMHALSVLTALTVALCAASAHAQSQAPGLWEQTMTMKSAGGEMEKAMADMQAKLAAMPPEQRQQVEQMMASRGMKMGAQGTSVKVCISKEQAARAAEPKMNGDCTNSDVRRTGNSMKFKFVCTKPRPSSGEGEWTFTSDKAYTGKIAATTEANGKPQQITMDMSGKWLSADCGDIKPFVMPAK